MASTKKSGVQKNETTPANPARPIVDITLLDQNSIPDTLKKIDEAIAQIRKGHKEEPTTKGKQIPGLGLIENMNKVEQLIQAHSYISFQEEAYKKSAEKIVPEGIKIPAFKVAGIAAKSWYEDIEERVIVVANQEKLDKLKKLRDELAQHLSEEQKKAESLKRIEALLTDAEI